MKTVKILSLSLALIILSADANAEWVEVERLDDGIRIYVDPASVRRADNGDNGENGENAARITHLVRWAEAQVDEGIAPYRSTVVHTDFDCGDKLEKYFSSVAYAGEMGDGARVLVDDVAAESWYAISASSMEEKLWKIACGVK